MKGQKTFSKGGIHPHDYKSYTEKKPIRNAHIPSISIIPMHQHMGKPAECIVQVGDLLKEGMLIGRSTGFFSANIYSPVPGTVTEIKEIYLPNGLKCQAVVVELAGEFDRSGKDEKKHEWEQLSGKELLDKISDMGIVGLGGATFPTHVKFSIKEGASVEYFVVNAVECEPFLTCDHRLMLEKTAEIMEGVRIVKKILNPDHVIIGIETNTPDAIEEMRRINEVKGLGFEIVPLKTQYPQGDEKQLLKATINREVPSGGLPLDIGAVVANVGSIFAIYEAVALNKPLVERVVTVTGSIIKNPSNLKAKIGTKIGELIEECGGFTEEPGKIVVGGPMMGFTTFDLDMPVTKGVSGILAFSKKEIKSARETSCIQCGRCIKACPLGLNPTTLFKWIDHLDYDQAQEIGLFDCKECGCCSYVCPAKLPLVHTMRLGKLMLRKKKG